MRSRRYSLFQQIDVRRNAHARQLDHEHDVDAHAPRTRICGYLHGDVAGDDDRHDAALCHAHAASVPPRLSISWEHRLGWTMFVLGSGYFFVWTLFGVVAYLIGVLVARGAMHSDPFSRTLPLAGGLALCIAGIYQLTPWKSACLKHCRDPLTLVANHLHGGRFGALRLGIHHGAFCAACCWALMLIQLVLGVMNLTVMLAVAVVIALEKLLSKGGWVAKAVGLAAIAAGVVISALSVRSL
jgi:hypothetical protein